MRERPYGPRGIRCQAGSSVGLDLLRLTRGRGRGVSTPERLEHETRHARVPLGGIVLEILVHDGDQLGGWTLRAGDAVLEAHEHLLAGRALLRGHERANGAAEVHEVVDDPGDI